MGEYTCYLITILYTCDQSLIMCALKVKDAIEFPMEPESRRVLHEMLPLHVRDCGPIVNVEEIFDIAGEEN